MMAIVVLVVAPLVWIRWYMLFHRPGRWSDQMGVWFAVMGVGAAVAVIAALIEILVSPEGTLGWIAWASGVAGILIEIAPMTFGSFRGTRKGGHS